jgi:predicted unusual protein kinase regulating ubiquinone biosynthesis (AarF/ABC1/UbiB family)
MIDAFFHVVGKDPAGIADDLIALDFLKPGTDPRIVRPVVEKMFEFHLNLKLKDVNFKELTYDLADVMYDYPFRLPSNFTYIMRALMTLEGIGIITDPEFNFFETAKPYAKEFMLRREGKDFRKMFVAKLMGRDENGKIVRWYSSSSVKELCNAASKRPERRRRSLRTAGAPASGPVS